PAGPRPGCRRQRRRRLPRPPGPHRVLTASNFPRMRLRSGAWRCGPMAAAAVPGGMSEPDGSAERTLTGRGPSGQSTRDSLVEVAWEVFSDKPYRNVRIAEIAARAGVSTGSFYTYFESKEALFRVVASAALEQLFSYDRVDPENNDTN